MHKTFLLTAIASVLSVTQPSEATEKEPQTNNSQPTVTQESVVANTEKKTTPFTPFTGKIMKNRVRVRLQPSLEGPILRELEQGDMIVVVGEDDEFYAVEPPEDVRAYIFRTYVLDGTVEGHHVNVRLEPTLDSPVVAQLNTGDSVTGRVSPLNSKWLEIAPPPTTHFYISKDYVEKIGDSNYMAKVQQRRNAVNQLLDTAYTASQESMQRPFSEVDYEDIVAKYEKVISQYPEFEQQVGRARDLLDNFKESYTKRKIAYLEAKSQDFANSEELQKENSKLSKALRNHQDQLNQLRAKLNKEISLASPAATVVVSEWQPQEDSLFQEWKEENEGTVDDFYSMQMNDATLIRGTIEPYTRNVRNRPGDYVLLNHNRVPIAFLYSTQLNLQDFAGQEVTIVGSQRPNNNFAFPAYFVLTIQ